MRDGEEEEEETIEEEEAEGTEEEAEEGTKTYCLKR